MPQRIRRITSNRLRASSSRRADRVWQEFESRLAHVLPDLTRDDCLILFHRTSEVFVQFEGRGRDGMRAEAISNDYFTKGRRLSPAAMRALVKWGWNRPTHSAVVEDSTTPAEGSPSILIEVPRRRTRFGGTAGVGVN